MGRCVYEGIYDPQSPLSDASGLRTDVMEALREQSYTVMRYPGGNFLSGYNWLDGVGPKADRPRRRELAWQSIETNQFGTNEFIDFCKAINTAPMLGVNMGTGTIESAGNLVEYCNAPTGTYWADLRASHGYREPHGVEYWCVGNEMDGPWQIGHLEAEAYGLKALEAAKMMKWDGGPQAVQETWQLSGTDPKAANSWEQPNLLTARQIANPSVQDGKIAISLPPLSFTAISLV